MTNNTTFSGNVSIGTDVVSSQKLKIGGTGCMIIPKGTTPERPTAVSGKIRFNTTIHKFEGRISDWHPISEEDAPTLYSFSSFTFTHVGVTGRTGPTLTQLVNHANYSSAAWRTNTNFFSLYNNNPGMQQWTVPATGTYRIQAYGAWGGVGKTSNSGGKGGHVKADFALTSGTKLVIICGQVGGDGGGTIGGGGGGAGWVLKPGNFTSTNDVYLVAGGGTGGPGNTYSWWPTGRRAASAGNSQGSSTSGGGAAGGPYTPGGGAGYGSDGAGSTTSLPSGGRRPTLGATGGYGGYNNNDAYYVRYGGFGGGGGNGAHSGGGGAGYGGAAGQNYGTGTVAGGSTSYIMPNGTGGVTVSNRTFVGNNVSSLNGFVHIEKL